MESPYDTIDFEQLPTDIEEGKAKINFLQERVKYFLETEFEQGFDREAVDGDNWMRRQKLWAECGVKLEAAQVCLNKVSTMLSILKDLPEVEPEVSEVYSLEDLPF